MRLSLNALQCQACCIKGCSNHAIMMDPHLPCLHLAHSGIDWRAHALDWYMLRDTKCKTCSLVGTELGAQQHAEVSNITDGLAHVAGGSRRGSSGCRERWKSRRPTGSSRQARRLNSRKRRKSPSLLMTSTALCATRLSRARRH